ncbi:hypothetical protein AAGS61_02935 [Lysinibacillus sp. KU-BSD001]|uniref:hypothetical protein n=1 Tax=Lysinibacillus sp. KU-BSD001 TaxID=3141328 RepID=UPI0036EE73C4
MNSNELINKDAFHYEVGEIDKFDKVIRDIIKSFVKDSNINPSDLKFPGPTDNEYFRICNYFLHIRFRRAENDSEESTLTIKKGKIIDDDTDYTEQLMILRFRKVNEDLKGLFVCSEENYRPLKKADLEFCVNEAYKELLEIR